MSLTVALLSVIAGEIIFLTGYFVGYFDKRHFSGEDFHRRIT